MLSFVCSIGNVPLAAVLWKAGISFGGVIAFIFADLLILPILNIYRKYYGLRMARSCWRRSTPPWSWPATSWRSIFSGWASSRTGPARRSRTAG